MTIVSAFSKRLITNIERTIVGKRTSIQLAVIGLLSQGHLLIEDVPGVGKTVLAADDEGAEIEYATIADDGSVDGEPSVSRSSWIELRDHASFPASHSTREWVSRSTALGDFEGWLYRVAEPDAATVREFFFVPSLPGAPVKMRILEGESTITELEQTARLRPETD